MTSNSRMSHEYYFTQFMALLDTIHDYGNVGRAESILNRHIDLAEEGIEEGNTNTQQELSGSLNSILIDFVMLGYFHKYFRTIMNLKDMYITKEEQCQNADGSFVSMCKKFYFPTYADKLIFRSSNPEETQKLLVFEELLKKEITFDASNIHNIENQDIVPNNYVLLNLGNKGVEEKELKGEKNRFVDIQDPAAKAYTQSGKLKQKFKIFTCEHVGKSDNNKIKFKSKAMSGLYSDGKATLYDFLLKFLKCEKITFIRDANKIDRFIDDSKCYYGIFTKYDSFTHKTQTGGMPMVNSDSNDGNDVYNAYINEFQEYALEKSKGELIFLDKIFVEYDSSYRQKFKLRYSINKNQDKDININRASNTNSKKYPKGLSQFLMLFDEINRKTFGYKKLASIGKDKKTKLIQQIQKIGLQVIEDTYKVSLKLDNENEQNTGNIIKLYPDEFIKSLFDFKRSMDYLYIKACKAANTSGQTWYNFPGKDAEFMSTEQSCSQHKFVFVTGDRSAAAYSIYLGNPTIYTPVIPTTEDAKDEFFCHRGDHLVMIYNPSHRSTKRNALKNNAAKDNAEPEANDDNVGDDGDDRVVDVFDKLLQNGNNINANAALSRIFGELRVSNDVFETYRTKCVSFMEDMKIPYDKKKRVLNVFNKGNNKTLDKTKDKEKVDETAKECDKFLRVSGGGGNLGSFLSFKIPLQLLVQFAEEGSPWYIFLHFYSQLHETITFFWFITYKTVFYTCFGDDMDKAGAVSEEVIEAEDEVKEQTKKSSSGRQVRIHAQAAGKPRNNRI